MPDTPEFLIADILPVGEVHLLGGSSGSGKTTFLFQIIADWQEGKPVLGHESYPVPYCYISIDRSRTSVGRTLGRLGLQQRITSIICREDLPANSTLAIAIAYARQKYPEAQAFFIEGFQTLVGDKGNSYTPVANFLASATTICAKNRYTILGVCHSPKMKIEEGFQHPRELLLGSVAWAAFSDTVIVMDLTEKTGIITVSVLPRNAPKEDFQLVFSPPNGVLISPPNDPKKLLVILIEAQPVGQDITKQEILEWSAGLGLSTRTTERIIAGLVDEGELVLTMVKGTYRRTEPTEN